jgi:hypothetical protein
MPLPHFHLSTTRFIYGVTYVGYSPRTTWATCRFLELYWKPTTLSSDISLAFPNGIFPSVFPANAVYAYYALLKKTHKLVREHYTYRRSHCKVRHKIILIFMDPFIVDYSVEISTRCSFVIEFIIAKFIEGSTCFERHIAHHQEL